MIDEKSPKRLSRLTAILTELQSKKIVTATSLAEKYGVNVRTIYRDIRALEESGVPILTEEGKGYSLMEGYRIPPIMFTESEAMALVTAEQIIAKDKDASLRKEFSSAITKIKSVLRNHSKQKTELLAESIFIGRNFFDTVTSKSLMDVQMAIAQQQIINISYKSENETISHRIIEPYMLYHSDDADWIIVAWCRLRKDFRSFRLDRMTKFQNLYESFKPDRKAFNQFVQKKFIDKIYP